MPFGGGVVRRKDRIEIETRNKNDNKEIDLEIREGYIKKTVTGRR